MGWICLLGRRENHTPESNFARAFPIFFFNVRLGFEFRALCMQSRPLYCLSHISSPFCSGYFGDGGLVIYLPKLASDCDLPDLSLPVSRITGVSHQAQLALPLNR
jgi:hypothetical protein